MFRRANKRHSVHAALLTEDTGKIGSWLQSSEIESRPEITGNMGLTCPRMVQELCGCE